MSSDRSAMIQGVGTSTLVFAAGFAAFGSWPQSADFTQLWAITHASWAGVSPYDEVSVQGLAPASATWPMLPWAYPPWTGLLYAPLGLLPLDVSGRLWMLFSAGALLASGVLASGGRRPSDAALAGALAALSFPALGVIAVGQLVAPIAIAAALLSASPGPVAVAIGLVLLATKPHLGAPVAVALAAHAAWTRDRRFGQGALLGAVLGAALAGTAFVLDPRWPSTWPAAVQRLRRADTVRICDTCASATHVLSDSPAGGWALALLLLVLVAAAILRRDLWGDRVAATSAGVLGALLFLPYVRNYDHALIAIPLIGAWARSDRPRRLVLGVAWTLPWIGATAGRSQGSWFLVASGVLVAGVWASLPATRNPGPGAA